MTKPYEARVRRGAALLDEKKPGWWDGGERKKVNLSTLDLKSCRDCVVGQLFRRLHGLGFQKYDRGLERLGLSSDEEAEEHGFCLDEEQRYYPTLTRRWVEEIENRRKEGAFRDGTGGSPLLWS